MNNPTTLDGSFSWLDEFRIAANCVDIWTVPLKTSGAVLEGLKQSLSRDERERALRFYAEKHRDSFAVGRGILRAILGSYISSRPEALIFHYGSKGKPYLKNHSGVQFNLGHSGHRAVYAIASDELGVDIELVKPLTDWEKISERFFSRREVEELKMLDPALQTAGFFACWTRKEAYIKATGEGLAAGLNKFYAGAKPSDSEGVIEIEEDQDGRAPQWYFKDLRLGDQYAGAVVTRLSTYHIRTFNFERTEDFVLFLEHRKKP